LSARLNSDQPELTQLYAAKPRPYSIIAVAEISTLVAFHQWEEWSMSRLVHG
jgi:hypothetical protein